LIFSAAGLASVGLPASTGLVASAGLAGSALAFTGAVGAAFAGAAGVAGASAMAIAGARNNESESNEANFFIEKLLRLINGGAGLSYHDDARSFRRHYEKSGAL
jgi:hypothetical protein